MSSPLFRSLSLLDPSGYVIIAIILALLVTGIALTAIVRARYASLERELRRHMGPDVDFQSRVLSHIVRDVHAARQLSAEVNTQAIIEQNFAADLKPLLTAERFVKASTGLLIILGLVGTFYGLTLSIGRLVALVSSGDASAATDVTQSLTHGLTQALSGMSVAFTCSLFGIVSAIIMTLLGVFANVADARSALMVRIEAFLDNELLGAAANGGGARAAGLGVGLGGAGNLEHAVAGFAAALDQMQDSVGRFEHALGTFATNTRDFGEFNLHLKDNIQRMSLCFADLSNALQQQAGSLRARDVRREPGR